jgi:DNA-binding response OmpR family regulator
MASHERTTSNASDVWTWSAASRLLAPQVPRAEATRRILLVHKEPKEAASFASALRTVRLDTVWVSSGVQALAAARLSRFDLLFIDLDLPDMSGTAMIKALRSEDAQARFIVVTRTVTASVTCEALHLGALGVLGKPLDCSDVIAAVRVALRWNTRQPEPARPRRPADYPVESASTSLRGTPRSIAERWAMLMLHTVRLDADPKTMSSWAKELGVSRSVLCECCRLVRVSPHRARDFARLLRVVCRSGPKWEPEMLLDVADARTLRKLMAQAHLTEILDQPPAPLEFLDTQEWIPRSNSGLLALRALLFKDGGRTDERHDLT